MNWYNVNITNEIIIKKWKNAIFGDVSPKENIIQSNVTEKTALLENQLRKNGISDENSTESAENIIASDVMNIVVDDIQKSKENGKIKIKLKDNMQVNNNYTIDIEFSGKISDNLIGLYRTSYNTTEGESR